MKHWAGIGRNFIPERLELQEKAKRHPRSNTIGIHLYASRSRIYNDI